MKQGWRSGIIPSIIETLKNVFPSPNGQKGICAGCGESVELYRNEWLNGTLLIGHPGKDGERCSGSHCTPLSLYNQDDD